MFQGLRGEKDDLQGQGQWAGKQHMQQMKLLDTFSSHCFNLLLKKKKKSNFSTLPFPGHAQLSAVHLPSQPGFPEQIQSLGLFQKTPGLGIYCWINLQTQGPQGIDRENHMCLSFTLSALWKVQWTPRVQFQSALLLALGSKKTVFHLPLSPKITVWFPRKTCLMFDPKKAKCYETAVSPTHSLLPELSVRLHSSHMESSASTAGFVPADGTVSYSQLKSQWLKAYNWIWSREAAFQLPEVSCWRII